MRNLSLSLTVLALATVSAAPAKAAEFMGLGDLPGGEFDSFAGAVSADGRVVVGWSGDGVFRWTAETGMVGLDLLRGDPSFSEAYVTALSADGSVMVGWGTSPSGSEGFRWSAETGMVGLGRVPGAQRSAYPEGMSADGEVIVGHYVTGCDNDGDCKRAPVRWTAETGMVVLEGPCMDDEGYAHAVSADGSVIVGVADFYPRASDPCGDFEQGGSFAFRWTAETGPVPLMDAPAGGTNPGAGATAVSEDGSVIVGSSRDSGFRWTAETGTVQLGLFSYPTAVSADGSVIVGGDWRSESGAVIWDAANGVRDLRDVFVNDYGLDLAGWWRLDLPIAISADARVIVGSGTNPFGNREAWMAVVPEPSTGALAVLGLLAVLAGLALRRRVNPLPTDTRATAAVELSTGLGT